MVVVSYGTREHRGTLQDSLLTSRNLSKETFNSLLGLYSFYGFDDRCKQFVFILRNITQNFSVHPLWMFIQVE